MLRYNAMHSSLRAPLQPGTSSPLLPSQRWEFRNGTWPEYSGVVLVLTFQNETWLDGSLSSVSTAREVALES